MSLTVAWKGQELTQQEASQDLFEGSTGKCKVSIWQGVEEAHRQYSRLTKVESSLILGQVL